jgi:hypothetical protein
MKNYKNCDPYQLRIDLQELITRHNQEEGRRRIAAEGRLSELKQRLDEVTFYISVEEGKT